MRKAIIDNATITSLQRLHGSIRVLNTDHVDGDISALEQFVTALLLFDEVYFVDDYIKKFRKGRRSQLPFLKPLAISDEQYASACDNARKLLGDQIFRVKAGQIDTDVLKGFLELVNTAVSVQWNMRSSDWFLTYRVVLDDQGLSDKYGPIFGMIWTQGYGLERARNPFPDPVLIDSEGSSVPARETRNGREYVVTGELVHFANHLNWLLERAAFYNLLAIDRGMAAALHPIRSACSVSLLARRSLLPSSIARALVEAMKQSTTNAMSDVRKISDGYFDVQTLPLFSAWLASNVRHFDEVIPKALELREEPEFRDLRRVLADIDDLSVTDFRKATQRANLALREIAKLGDLPRSKYKVGTPQGSPHSTSISLSIPGVDIVKLGLGLPSKTMGIDVRKVTDAFRPSYRAVFRNLTADLTEIPRLGALYDKLASAVQYGKDAGPSAWPPRDERKYLRARTHWKEPM